MRASTFDIRRILGRSRYRLSSLWTRARTKYFLSVYFVHINKTAGSSIERALGLPFQHRTASEFIELVGEARWRRAFTFSFVRNPWDKVASHYRYRLRTNQTGLASRGIDFNEWVALAYRDRDPRFYDKPKMFMPQARWICDPEGRILVDFVGRYERLEEDFGRVTEVLGVSASLPHLKGTGQADYREMYNTDSVEIIAQRFEEDIRRFNYSFE